MTPSEWDTYVSVIWGSAEPRDTPFKGKVLTTPSEFPFLIYDTYDWWPSSTRNLSNEDST
jgi:hypothetical protein